MSLESLFIGSFLIWLDRTPLEVLMGMSLYRVPFWIADAFGIRRFLIRFELWFFLTVLAVLCLPVVTVQFKFREISFLIPHTAVELLPRFFFSNAPITFDFVTIPLAILAYIVVTGLGEQGFYFLVWRLSCNLFPQNSKRYNIFLALTAFLLVFFPFFCFKIFSSVPLKVFQMLPGVALALFLFCSFYWRSFKANHALREVELVSVIQGINQERNCTPKRIPTPSSSVEKPSESTESTSMPPSTPANEKSVTESVAPTEIQEASPETEIQPGKNRTNQNNQSPTDLDSLQDYFNEHSFNELYDFTKKVLKKEALRHFFSKNIESNFETLKTEKNLFKIVLFLLCLLEIEGDCPSIYNLSDDRERFTQKVFGLLSQVPLFEHSIRVATIALKKSLQKNPTLFNFNLTPLLIVCLGHDISKLPSLVKRYQNAPYTKNAHAIRSGEFLATMLADYPKAQKILEAITNHHMPLNRIKGAPNQFLISLTEADQEARNLEKQMIQERTGSVTESTIPESPATVTGKKQVSRTSHSQEEDEKIYSSPSVITIPSDFPFRELFNRLGDMVNCESSVKPNYFLGISQPNGYVYFSVNILYNTIIEVAQNAGIDDIVFSDKTYKESVLYSFVKYFEKENLVLPCGKSFYSYIYQVDNLKTRQSNKISMVAFKPSTFGETIENYEALRNKHQYFRYVKIMPHKEKNQKQ